MNSGTSWSCSEFQGAPSGYSMFLKVVWGRWAYWNLSSPAAGTAGQIHVPCYYTSSVHALSCQINGINLGECTIFVSVVIDSDSKKSMLLESFAKDPTTCTKLHKYQLISEGRHAEL